MTRPSTGWDAIVIGAGHNGLVAANHLLDRGWSVLVLEAAEQPGGAVASRSDQLAPGFVTDQFSAFYPLAAVSRPLRELGLRAFGLRWAHAPAVLAHVLPDDRAAVLSRDAAATAASVDGFASGDGQAWMDLVGQWSRIGPALTGALLDPFPPLRSGIRLASKVGVRGAAELARTAAVSAYEWTRERFAGEGAQMLVAGNAAHADLPLTAPGSAMLGWLLAMLGQSAGFPVPVGGAGKLTEALVERLRSRGGTLMTGEPVQRILIDDGTAVGVLTAAGREHQARHVLADVDAPTLYRELVGDPLLPAGLRADLDRFAWDPSTVKINWALDSPIPWTAAEVGRAGTVHLGADLLGVVDYSHALSTHRVPAQPFVLLGQMSTADPTRSPHGTESVWAYTHLPHRAWDAAQVDVCATGVQDLLERHAPGFGDRIIARSVQSPADLAGADANLRLGAINGGTAQIFQQLVLRPTPGLGRPETFVDRLYLAGASAHPGGGVHGACGRNAARAALLRERAATRPLGLGAQRATALLAQGRP